MRLAMWLLQRFGVLERNESLMGDLAEERANGRSASWFWRQTLAAIGDAVAHDLRAHWLLAMRAIATGWGLWLAWARVMNLLASHRVWIVQPLVFFTFLLWPGIIGWVVARTHRAHQGAMVLAYAATVTLYGAWDLTVHYSQMKSCTFCEPDLWGTNLVIYCLDILLTAIGGMLTQPSTRTAPRTRTP
jgi:hypothetical protein